MPSPLAAPYSYFADGNGAPLASGNVYTYTAGTTTPKAAYTDSTGSTPLANPVPLDSAGRAQIWLSGSYKIVVKDSLGNTISTADNITGTNSSAQIPWAVAAGTADAITATYNPANTSLTDGLQLQFRASAANATTTPTFAPDGLTTHTITKKGGTALAIGDITANLAEYILTYNLANTRWELLNPSTGSAPVLLVTNTPSAAASTSFSSTYITTTYKSYEIRMFGIFASGGAGVDLYLTASVDNGSNYLASNYAWDAGAAGSSTSDSKINITGGAGVVGTTLAACNDGIIAIYNPAAGSRAFSCDWKIHKNSLASIASGDIPWGAGTNSGTTAINNIKLALNGQNINGTFELWGIP